MKTRAYRGSLAGVALVAAFAASLAHATPSYSVDVSGFGTEALNPSSDTIKLDANNTSAGLGDFNLQSGLYFVGDSGWENDVLSYSFSENVTIDGQTQAINVTMQNTVRNPTGPNTDFLTIFSSPAVYFSGAGVDFTTGGYVSDAHYVGGSSKFSLTADLSRPELFSVPQQSVPEPMTLALFGVGLLGLVALRRRPRMQRA